LYYAKRIIKEKCSKPQLFSKDIATQYHEGPVAFYDNNTKIIFTQTNTTKKIFNTKAIKARNGSISLNLYTADILRDHITNIKPFKYNSNDFSSANPTVSNDGKNLIFSSDGPDSYGGSDLYLCHFENNEWTAPKNLGKDINTSQSELFPYLNGNILYFSSDGHKGLGGLDIYYTKLVNDTPTKIINLGSQINSPSDDFGFITKNGNSGYFASNRGDENVDNIYFTEKQAAAILSAHIKVYDKKTHALLKHSDLEVIDSIANKSIIAYDNNGDTLFKYQIAEEVIYKVIASHQNYFSRDTIFHSGDKLKGILEYLLRF
jgi:Tol biopolymer transport system component